MASPPVRTAPRRFGAHLSLTWWKPLVIIVVPPLAMIILQIVLFTIVGLIDDGGGQAEAVGPLQLLAVNLSMGITGVLAVPLISWGAKVPWRTILSSPRVFDRSRLARYLLWGLGTTALANAALALLAPGQTPWVGVGVTGTTMALLVVIVLTTPLAAVSEELLFRGAVMPAVASWVRPERIALALGVIVSSLAFAITHLATDPWLFSYHVFLGLATAVMAIRSRGLEAPIAFHVANNTFTAVLNVLLAGGGDFSVARTAGAGGPHLLIPALFVLALVIVVWRREGKSGEPTMTKAPVT
ncbi:CPBP family intramembrane glutamic endopeptidase [Nesterenkonia sp. F]|uniref:CPBP family intramembrane glutamic endopeptidase n=1 Tax=Nesterenkonia sp. F TaxID=795955 RepID=UPI00031A9640|nr:type II CAAX endopeptidase family protein [Nesterenkonia sp. F]